MPMYTGERIYTALSEINVLTLDGYFCPAEKLLTSLNSPKWNGCNSLKKALMGLFRRAVGTWQIILRETVPMPVSAVCAEAGGWTTRGLQLLPVRSVFPAWRPAQAQASFQHGGAGLSSSASLYHFRRRKDVSARLTSEEKKRKRFDRSQDTLMGSLQRQDIDSCNAVNVAVGPSVCPRLFLTTALLSPRERTASQ